MEQGLCKPMESYGSIRGRSDNIYRPCAEVDDSITPANSSSMQNGSVWDMISRKYFRPSDKKISISDNILIFAPVIFLVSLFMGICFYHFIDGWDLPTSIYYATQVLIGEM